MNILYIDACPRKNSKTREAADFLADRLKGNITRVRLSDAELPEIDDEEVRRREEDCIRGDYSRNVYDFAKQFSEADRIIIAASFWDMSFPSVLKKYIEAITINGITFSYSEDGQPQGHCRADKLYYVTTAGGPTFGDMFGFGYVEAMAKGMYGIGECVRFVGENMDVYGNDADAILEELKDEIRKAEL